MQECISQQNIRSIKQQLCQTKQQITLFYQSLIQYTNTPQPVCVVKPNMSAGTDNVWKCSCLMEVLNAFDIIAGGMNGLGHINDGALIQVSYCTVF